MTKLNHSGNPLYTRPNETVGGGFFVIRRGSYAGRIKPGAMPFEHPTAEAAFKERDRLNKEFPDCSFSVFAEIDKL